MTPAVLVISSHVAASSVGLRAAAAGVERAGLDTMRVPTTVLGRHPGWGPPGGRALDPDHFADVLKGALAHPDAARLAWVLTGYFAHPDQPRLVAEAVAPLLARERPVKLCVDPVFGDEDTGLYVPEDIVAAVETHLLPLAHLVTPNAWEAERLTGRAALAPDEARSAARALGRPALITSVRRPGRIGAVYADATRAVFAHAPARETVPRGTGDLLAGGFVGALARGAPPPEALLDAMRALEGAIAAAVATGAAELPVGAAWSGASGPVTIEAIEP